MLRTDTDEIDSTIDVLRTELSTVHVNQYLVLVEGERPANASFGYGMAIATGVLAVPILIGWLIGYIVFRPSRQQPAAGTGMTGTLRVRISGVLPGPGTGLRTRDMRAELHLGQPAPGAAADAPLPMDLYWARGARIWAARLTPGLSEGVAGDVYPLRGRYPAIRVRFGQSRIVIGFEDAASRDAAYEQMRHASWQTSRVPTMLPWQPMLPYSPGFGPYSPGFGPYSPGFGPYSAPPFGPYSPGFGPYSAPPFGPYSAPPFGPYSAGFGPYSRKPPSEPPSEPSAPAS